MVPAASESGALHQHEAIAYLSFPVTQRDPEAWLCQCCESSGLFVTIPETLWVSNLPPLPSALPTSSNLTID